MMQNQFLAILVVSFGMASSAIADVCPATSPSDVSLSAAVKTSYDKNSKTYRYEYRFSNLPGAKSKLARIFLATFGDAESSSTPPEWTKGYSAATGGQPGFVRLSTLTKPISPGKSQDGFVLTSPNPPGIVRMYSEGSIEEPLKAVSLNGDDEATPDCPGFFHSETSILNEIDVGTTIGPSSPAQVDLKALMKFKRTSAKVAITEEILEPELDPTDSGNLEVIVFGQNEFDLSKVDRATIVFGPGGAKPTSIVVLPADKLDRSGWKSEIPRKGTLLKAEFSLAEVKIRCGLDKALIFSANAEGSPVAASVPIRPAICGKSNWAKSKLNSR